MCRILPFALIAIGLSSCSTPQEATTASRYTVGPSATRHHAIGSVGPVKSDNKLVAETTQENFFTWLFSLDDDAASSKKQPAKTKAKAPTIPATKVHSSVLARSTRGNTRIVVDVSRQKAFLLVGGDVAIETPVSTARPGKYTPRGSFNISERVRAGKISTIYGVAMPCWMRLSGTVYGVHAGYLPGYPASAGCVRLPADAAALIFENTRSGTPVSIYSSWNGA
jgi:lipoprotein-anchoring transpeptidase ErfK/SrfK